MSLERANEMKSLPAVSRSGKLALANRSTSCSLGLVNAAMARADGLLAGGIFCCPHQDIPSLPESP